MNIMLSQEEIRKLKAFKDELHAHPELSHKEYETTKKIRAFLRDIEGVEEVDLGLETGLVAVIRGAKEGKRIGLRADIDAIEQTEEADVPVRSAEKGVMHGCGHDFHTASLLGAAMILSRCRKEMAGQAVLIFQPAEETTDGAAEVIRRGLFEKVRIDMIFSGHNRPEIPVGKVVLKKGVLMAAKSNFKIVVNGVGGHGSMPHLCVDPIVCAAAMIQSLQTVVSRNTDPVGSVVLTIGSIMGGSLENLVVDHVEMTGSVRALSQESYRRALERVESIVENTLKAYECTGGLEYILRIPPIDNGEEMYRLAEKAAEEVVGKEGITDSEPTLASEDFALMMEKAPSFFYWFGSGTEGEPCHAWHNAKFHTNDEGLPIASKILACSVLTAIAAGEA